MTRSTADKALSWAHFSSEAFWSFSFWSHGVTVTHLAMMRISARKQSEKRVVSFLSHRGIGDGTAALAWPWPLSDAMTRKTRALDLVALGQDSSSWSSSASAASERVHRLQPSSARASIIEDRTVMRCCLLLPVLLLRQ